MKRTLAGMLIAFSVAPETIPVWRSPMRAWKRFTAAVSPLSQASPLASAPREVAFDRQALAQFRHRRALRSRADRGDVGRPAAGVDDRRIALGRLGGGEESVGLKRRAGIVAERRLARRRRRRDFLRLRRRCGLGGNGRGRGRRSAGRRISPRRRRRRALRHERAHEALRRRGRARGIGRAALKRCSRPAELPGSMRAAREKSSRQAGSPDWPTAPGRSRRQADSPGSAPARPRPGEAARRARPQTKPAASCDRTRHERDAHSCAPQTIHYAH